MHHSEVGHAATARRVTCHKRIGLLCKLWNLYTGDAVSRQRRTILAVTLIGLGQKRDQLGAAERQHVTAHKLMRRLVLYAESGVQRMSSTGLETDDASILFAVIRERAQHRSARLVQHDHACRNKQRRLGLFERPDV